MNKAEEAAREAALEQVKRDVPVENGGGGLDEITRDMACVIGWNAAIAYAKREQQWVLVSERLPKLDEKYWWVTSRMGIVIRLEFFLETQEFAGYALEDIVAWMPDNEPDPYQPKTDGDKAEVE